MPRVKNQSLGLRGSTTRLTPVASTARASLAHRAESRQIHGVAHVTKNVGGNETNRQARDGRRTGVAERAAAERAAEGEMVLLEHRRES